MIKTVNNSQTFLTQNTVSFGKKEQNIPEQNSVILPNTLETRVRQKTDKTVNAFTEYPVKGLQGDVNSDFFEFLAMGIVPYLIGSGMFMLMFNLVRKLGPKARKFAEAYGGKMALGVLFYGIGKTLANDLVTRPVALATGVDIELPYRNVNVPLPTQPGEKAEVKHQIQHRKVYDSREFFRKDLIAEHPDYGIKYYEKIGRKNGLGENLNDPVTEVTPIIQTTISTTKVAKSLSSYCWAGAAVGLAMQNSWLDFFDAISNRRRHIPKAGESLIEKFSSRFKNAGHNFVDISKTFGKSFTRACKTLWCGDKGTSGFMKHAGKSWLIFTTALTVGSIANVIYKARHMGNPKNKTVIDKTKESTVI